MENEIKKLVEKWDGQKNMYNQAWENACEDIIKDLKSLLAFKQKNCCEKPNVIVDNRENALVISLTRVNNRADFRRKIEDLYIKYIKC